MSHAEHLMEVLKSCDTPDRILDLKLLCALRPTSRIAQVVCEHPDVIDFYGDDVVFTFDTHRHSLVLPRYTESWDAARHLVKILFPEYCCGLEEESVQGKAAIWIWSRETLETELLCVTHASPARGLMILLIKLAKNEMEEQEYEANHNYG